MCKRTRNGFHVSRTWIQCRVSLPDPGHQEMHVHSLGLALGKTTGWPSRIFLRREPRGPCDARNEKGIARMQHHCRRHKHRQNTPEIPSSLIFFKGNESSSDYCLTMSTQHAILIITKGSHRVQSIRGDRGHVPCVVSIGKPNTMFVNLLCLDNDDEEGCCCCYCCRWH